MVGRPRNEASGEGCSRKLHRAESLKIILKMCHFPKWPHLMFEYIAACGTFYRSLVPQVMKVGVKGGLS